MQRYFIPQQNIDLDKVVINNTNDIHHIKNVMRMTVGSQLVCTDPDGNVMECSITVIKDNEINLTLNQYVNSNTELPVHVTIVQGLPKKNKLELVVQKGTELGCNFFNIYQADRSIVKWDQKKAEQKLARLTKIAGEASEQSSRNKIPTVQFYHSIKDILKNSTNYDIMLFAYEEEAKSSTYTSINKQLQRCKEGMKLLICIGPEGGFSKEEVELMKEYQVKPVRLGPRILRTETASMYALSCISYHFEEMGCS